MKFKHTYLITFFCRKGEESVEAVSDDTDDDSIETEDEESDASERDVTSEADSGNRYMLASNPPSVDNSVDYSTIDRFVFLPLHSVNYLPST